MRLIRWKCGVIMRSNVKGLLSTQTVSPCFGSGRLHDTRVIGVVRHRRPYRKMMRVLGPFTPNRAWVREVDASSRIGWKTKQRLAKMRSKIWGI